MVEKRIAIISRILKIFLATIIRDMFICEEKKVKSLKEQNQNGRIGVKAIALIVEDKGNGK